MSHVSGESEDPAVKSPIPSIHRRDQLPGITM